MPRRSYLVSKRARELAARECPEQKRRKLSTDEDAADTKAAIKAKKYIRNNSMDMSQMTPTMAGQITHSLYPAFTANAVPVKSIDDLRTYPSIRISPPQAIFVSEDHPVVRDICHKRTRARWNHRYLLKIAHSCYQRLTKSKPNVRKVSKEHTYPISLFTLAERLECNPNPYFSSSYDYFYTGGNLCALPYENAIGTRVLHINNKDLQRMNVGVISSMDDSVALNPLYSLETVDTTSEVFEVHSLRSPFAHHNEVIATRQLNTVTLYALQSEMKRIKPVTQLKATKTPIIGFAQSPSVNNNMLVSSMTQQLRLYDLRTNKWQSYEFNDNDMNQSISWNMVRPWQGQTFLYANETKYCFADMRTRADDWCMHNAHNLYDCDVISSVAISNYDHLFYMATSHNLYCLDSRNIKEMNTICRWTHQMEYAPAFIDTLPRDNSEIIALSSAVPNDLCICELNEKRNEAEVQYAANMLPYQPTTIKEAYDHARNSGKCLRPDANLKNRILLSTTGLNFARDCNSEAGALLLTSNSIGDIYAAKISTRLENDDNADDVRADATSDEYMAQYADKVCANAETTLQYTTIVDLNPMRRILLCRNLNKADDDILGNDDVHEPKRRTLGRWQKSIRTLHSYKDALVKNILDIWDINADEADAKDLKYLNQNFSTETDSIVDINKWLVDSVSVPAPSFVMTRIEASELNESSAGYTHLKPAAPKLNKFTAADSLLMREDSLDAELHTEYLNRDTFLDSFPMQLQSTQITNDDATLLINDIEEVSMTVVRKSKRKTKSKYVKGF